MPTQTYIPLASLTLSSSAASVTFSSISQAYRDLVLVMSIKASAAGASTTTVLNSDTGANYNYVNMSGNGSTATSASSSASTLAGIGIVETDFTQITHNIMDYSATDKHKTVLTRGDRASASTLAVANRWANTAAVTTITYSVTGTTIAAGSTFCLYGIAS